MFNCNKKMLSYIALCFESLRFSWGIADILDRNIHDPGASYWEHDWMDDPLEILLQSEEFPSYSCHY